MFTVDPAFSVYHLIERIEYKSILFNHRRTMSLISYEIENATLIDGAQTRIFAGFQYLSKFAPQIKRYEEIAATAASVYVFGVPDTNPPPLPKINYIPLSPHDQLAREWFVISYGKAYASALATEEVSQITDPDNLRRFKGIWTFDLTIIDIMHNWLASLVDAHPLPENAASPDEQRAYMTLSMARLSARAAAVPAARDELTAALRSVSPQ